MGVVTGAVDIVSGVAEVVGAAVVVVVTNAMFSVEVVELGAGSVLRAVALFPLLLLVIVGWSAESIVGAAVSVVAIVLRDVSVATAVVTMGAASGVDVAMDTVARVVATAVVGAVVLELLAVVAIAIVGVMVDG